MSRPVPGACFSALQHEQGEGGAPCALSSAPPCHCTWMYANASAPPPNLRIAWCWFYPTQTPGFGSTDGAHPLPLYPPPRWTVFFPTWPPRICRWSCSASDSTRTMCRLGARIAFVDCPVACCVLRVLCGKGRACVLLVLGLSLSALDRTVRCR